MKAMLKLFFSRGLVLCTGKMCTPMNDLNNGYNVISKKMAEERNQDAVGKFMVGLSFDDFNNFIVKSHVHWSVRTKKMDDYTY